MDTIREDEVWYEFFYTELMTGLRRGEIMALQWDDLDFETGVLNVSRQVYGVRGKLEFSQPKTKNSIRKIVLPRRWWRSCGSTRKRYTLAGCFRPR